MKHLGHINGWTAWIATICIGIVLAKYISKRIHKKWFDKILMKSHKIFDKSSIILGCIHGIIALLQFHARFYIEYITGVMCLIILFLIKKSSKYHKRRQWINHHRIWSLVLILMLLIHIITI